MLVVPTFTFAAVYLSQQQQLGRGLAVLGAWALLNLVVSGYCLANADRRYEPYFFHAMNVGWGLVNAGLACWGVLHLQFVAPPNLGLAEMVQEQLSNENLFIFNSGLDVAYLTAGFWLRALALEPGRLLPARLLGFGRSLWLQGGFLLLFDVVMWGAAHWSGRGWLPLL